MTINVRMKVSARLQRLLDGSAMFDFVRADRAAAKAAYGIATEVSRDTFNRLTPATDRVANRPGRSSTQGTFAQNIQWHGRVENGRTTVYFDWQKLNSVAPRYWLVQEVGTNRSYEIFGSESGTLPPGGRNGKIRGQRGRTIPFGLQWGIGGVYVPPGRADGAQLSPLSQLSVTPDDRKTMHQMKIHKEITGKHYIRDGANAGFEFYRKEILAEYRRVFQ